MMKLTSISLIFFAALSLVSCEQKKKETQTSIEEKAKQSSSKQPLARPKTGMPPAEAAKRVGNQNDQRAQQSNELLNKANQR